MGRLSMRVRTWTALITLLGVLLHAGALVRHHGIMLGTHLLEQALTSDSSFCRGDPGGGSPAGFPGLPKPTDTQSGCPVCTGQAPTCAVTAAEHLIVAVRFAVMARWSEPERVNPALRHAVCPPPRGPPASVLPA
jgi:hypothetical protein